MNVLQELIDSTSVNKSTFAKMVGVSYQKLTGQLNSKNPLIPAITYAKILGLKELKYKDDKINVHIEFYKL